MKLIASTLTSVALVLVAGCSSVAYDDPDRVETLTIDYGSTDLQELAGAMVDSLITAPALNYLENPGKGDDKRVIVYMGGVDNRTSEHLDTEGITDKIRTHLLKSGKFRFVAGDQGQDEIGEQVRFQQGSGRVNPEMARSFGAQLGADVVLYGVLRSIDKHKGRSIESGGMSKDDVYYQFVFNCVNIDSGEFLWSEEKELRKRAKTGLFGG
jgi:uncharacterized protein (TIGR02722 family)